MLITFATFGDWLSTQNVIAAVLPNAMKESFLDAYVTENETETAGISVSWISGRDQVLRRTTITANESARW